MIDYPLFNPTPAMPIDLPRVKFNNPFTFPTGVGSNKDQSLGHDHKVHHTRLHALHQYLCKQFKTVHMPCMYMYVFCHVTQYESQPDNHSLPPAWDESVQCVFACIQQGLVKGPMHKSPSAMYKTPILHLRQQLSAK